MGADRKWVVSRHSKYLLKIEDNKRLIVIAELYQSHLCPELTKDVESNAYLMAAAPDLLEALRDVLEELKAAAYVVSLDRGRIEAARAAIAKATNTSPEK